MFSGKPHIPASSTITNDGFWPDLVVADFQRTRKIPSDLDESVQVSALLNAATEINTTLSDKQAEYQQSGVSSSEQIPGLSANGKSWAVSVYTSAVFAKAKAILLPEFASVVQRKEANNAYEQEAETRDTLMTEANLHINRLLGTSNVRVVLI